ncbi:hypothetical protein [Kitasatospora camelliae]|uniref:Uncharacterized protein n=1 Tax=Kitasatospora camelliae TaxID=3156397 RepID=A0AAU8JPR5_9ACTN
MSDSPSVDRPDEESGQGGAAVRRGRLALALAGGALIAAAATGWALGGGSKDRPEPPVAAPTGAPPAEPDPAATPSPTLSPTPDATLDAAPSPSPSLTAAPDTPGAAGSAPTGPAATRRATSTAVPRWQISPRTDHPNSDNTVPSRNPTCAYDAAGRLMMCGPVLTPTPVPDPARSRSSAPSTVPPGGRP